MREEMGIQLEPPIVQDFMTAAVGMVHTDTPLDETVDFLLEKNISNAPVVREEGGKNILIGFISEQDCLDYLTNEFFCNIPDVTVMAVMKKLPLCVTPDTDIFTVANIFVKFGRRHLPVVKKKELVGIVSRRDTLRGLHAYHRKLGTLKNRCRNYPDIHELINHRFIIK